MEVAQFYFKVYRTLLILNIYLRYFNDLNASIHAR